MPAPRPAAGGQRARTVVWALLAATFLPAGASAEDPASAEAQGLVATGSGPLEARFQVEKLVTRDRPDGSVDKRYVEAQSLRAGEEIYYTVRVTNPGKAPVTGVVVTKRLPFGVDYIRGSAVGPASKVEFSVDGGSAFAPAKKSDTAQYTHVRWILEPPLAPGATALFRFRATFR